jgi:hypothetical protein
MSLRLSWGDDRAERDRKTAQMRDRFHLWRGIDLGSRRLPSSLDGNLVAGLLGTSVDPRICHATEQPHQFGRLTKRTAQQGKIVCIDDKGGTALAGEVTTARLPVSGVASGFRGVR